MLYESGITSHVLPCRVSHTCVESFRSTLGQTEVEFEFAQRYVGRLAHPILAPNTTFVDIWPPTGATNHVEGRHTPLLSHQGEDDT